MEYLTWKYQKNFISKTARGAFRKKAIINHDKGCGFICYLDCKGIQISPRKLLTLMESLGFTELVVKRTTELYAFKLFLLNKLYFNFLLTLSENKLIEKWRSKHKQLQKKVDVEDYCLQKIRDRELNLPFIDIKRYKEKVGNIDRLANIKKKVIICPQDYKNVSFNLEADQYINGPFVIDNQKLLVVTREDYKKDKLLVDFYMKKEPPNILKFRIPNIRYYSYFEENNLPGKFKGELDNGIKYYYYNLPYEYYSQHLPRFNELYFDEEENCWRSNIKSISGFKELFRNVKECGFKNPLCFTLTRKGQLIPLCCSTRIMLACYLKMPVIPAVIFITASRDEEGDLDNRDLANKYLNPDILFL